MSRIARNDSNSQIRENQKKYKRSAIKKFYDRVSSLDYTLRALLANNAEESLFSNRISFQSKGSENAYEVMRSVCLAWWRFVFQGRKSTARALHHCQQLHLADTGKQYRNIPLRYFSELTWINLTRTTISSGDFLKLVGTAKHLEMVNIESCSRISEEAIFKAKRFLPCLRRINISFNDQLSVLAVACLCSCSSLRDIRARGIRLQAKELLFLTRTFPRLGNGRLTLDIGFEGGDYFVDAIDALSDFDLF